MKAKIFAIIFSLLGTGGTATAISLGIYNNEQMWNRKCDGINVVESCTGEDGLRYKKYLFHEAVEEQTKMVHYDAEPAKTHTVHHPAEVAKTHIEHHDAEYGTYSYTVCQKTTISYKNGSCALSQCWDGEYSGSSGRGTCSHHGGVMRHGPFYTTYTETYLIKEAWDEVVVDVPAKDAWDETIVDVPAKPAHDEKVIVVEARDAYTEKILAEA